VRRFELVLPESVDDCLRALAQRGPETKLLAGGTDLLPQLKNGLLKPARVIDLSGVKRLGALEPADGRELRIGAAVTARTLELDATVRARYLSIAESGALVGSVQIRNLATLGGNLCNAAPSADMAPPLLALDAEAVITGPKGERRVPIEQFFQSSVDGLGDTLWTIGTYDGLNLLSEILTKPQYGSFKKNATANTYEFQSYTLGRSEVDVPIGVGRRQYSRYDWDSGYYLFDRTLERQFFYVGVVIGHIYIPAIRVGASYAFMGRRA